MYAAVYGARDTAVYELKDAMRLYMNRGVYVRTQFQSRAIGGRNTLSSTLATEPYAVLRAAGAATQRDSGQCSLGCCVVTASTVGSDHAFGQAMLHAACLELPASSFVTRQCWIPEAGNLASYCLKWLCAADILAILGSCHLIPTLTQTFTLVGTLSSTVCLELPLPPLVAIGRPTLALGVRLASGEMSI